MGKSHLASAIGLALVENGYRVLFTRTTDLVQRMQVSRRELALESLIVRLDQHHLLILDDLAYVQKDQTETSVLFGLISARYERRSLLITANQPFGEWGKVFPDETTAVAAVESSMPAANTSFVMKNSDQSEWIGRISPAGAGRFKKYAERRALAVYGPTGYASNSLIGSMHTFKCCRLSGL